MIWHFASGPSRLPALLVGALMVFWSSSPARSQQPKQVPLEDSTSSWFWATFSRDKTLVSAAAKSGEITDTLGRRYDKYSHTMVWDVGTGRVKARLPVGSQFMPTVFSPDGKLLAGIADGKAVKILELASGKETKTLRVEVDMVRAVSFSPDSKHLASGNANDTVTVWELATGRERTLRGHESTVFCVAFSPDGTLLASGSRDETVKLWSVASGMEKASLKGPSGTIASVAFSSDGKFLVGGIVDYNRIGSPTLVLIWDLPSGKERARLHRSSRPTLSNDGKLLATIGEKLDVVNVWDTVTAERRFTHKLESGSNAVAATFSDNRTLMVVVENKSKLELLRLGVGRK